MIRFVLFLDLAIRSVSVLFREPPCPHSILSFAGFGKMNYFCLYYVFVRDKFYISYFYRIFIYVFNKYILCITLFLYVSICLYVSISIFLYMSIFLYTSFHLFIFSFLLLSYLLVVFSTPIIPLLTSRRYFTMYKQNFL